MRRSGLMLALFGALAVMISLPTTSDAIKCYVCKSNIHPKKATNSDGTPVTKKESLKPEETYCHDVKSQKTPLIDCNSRVNGNNAFLQEVYGTEGVSSDGPRSVSEITSTASAANQTQATLFKRIGWLAGDNVTDKNGSVPNKIGLFNTTAITFVGSDYTLSVPHILGQVWINQTNKHLVRPGPYDRCRTIVARISLNKINTEVVTEELTYSPHENIVTVRTCGWSQTPDVENKEKCRDTKLAEGSFKQCSCKDKDGCNDESSVSQVMGSTLVIILSLSTCFFKMI